MKAQMNIFYGMASVALIALSSLSMRGEILLPSIFTDNMVVQRNATLTVAGTGKPLSTVTFRADWPGGKAETRTDNNGHFEMKIPTPPAGGPYTIIIDDGTGDTGRKVLQNVLSGEVWLCSGQSNMEFPVKGDWAQLMDADCVVATMQRPALRLLQIRNTTSVAPLDNARIEFGWVESSPAAASFSAIGYLCGKLLQDSLNVPVGVIDATWGGTPVEAWTPREALEEVPGMEFRYGMLGLELDEQALRDKEIMRVYEAYDHPGKITYPFDRIVMQKGKGWGKMPVPSMWEANVLPGFDGVVAMQYELNLPAEAAGKPLHLCLGAIDDWDTAYFNGEPVGSDMIFDRQRDYEVDGRLVKAGTNVITVEIVDNGGGGGIWKSTYADVDGHRYSLDGEWNYAVITDFSKIEDRCEWPESQNYPTVLYNAMVNPLKVMPLAGVFWYQGCANVGNADRYEICFKNMIEGWRKAFGNPSLPFYFVQLAGFLQPVTVQPDSEWAMLRDAQAKALQLPHTGMATAIDLGNPVDIHPTNKGEVARRLAMLALDKTYGLPQQCEAPRCIDVRTGNGYVDLTFDLDIKATGGVPTGFIIKGDDGAWAYANARLTSDRTIRLSSPLAPAPVAVRYNWADYPGGNLYGVSSGLPVTPVATDNFGTAKSKL